MPVTAAAIPMRSPREGARRLLRGGPRFFRAKAFGWDGGLKRRGLPREY